MKPAITLPEDITRKIRELFGEDSRDEVVQLLCSLWSAGPLTVGPDQLARSILVLSDGNIEQVRAIFESQFWQDPRDVVVAADEKLGRPGHYLTESFD
jgi:hypothetical protein